MVGRFVFLIFFGVMKWGWVEKVLVMGVCDGLRRV